MEGKGKLKPFITSKVVKGKGLQARAEVPLPLGYASLFEYEEDRRVTAVKVFSKLMENQIQNIKEMYFLWSSKGKKSSP